ncbi:hypothetical protein BKA63DRAFT_490532 [Paraphoma chrysanthemicola]|nr:hypothetical protein BKA63DRAFT_490532 [Paraphoma chrysanthemicola]
MCQGAEVTPRRHRLESSQQPWSLLLLLWPLSSGDPCPRCHEEGAIPVAAPSTFASNWLVPASASPPPALRLPARHRGLLLHREGQNAWREAPQLSGRLRHSSRLRASIWFSAATLAAIFVRPRCRPPRAAGRGAVLEQLLRRRDRRSCRFRASPPAR